MTGQELVVFVKARLGIERNAELAQRLGFGSYYSPNRVKRWVNGNNDPDYEATIALLNLVGAINWSVLDVPRSPDAIAVALDALRRHMAELEDQLDAA